ncbi:MAG: glycosyltransferase family 4 protein [Sphingobacterium siyangense]
MTKIIFVHLFNDRSGSPKVLSQVIQGVHQSGHEIELLTSSHKNGFLDCCPGFRHQIFYKRSDNKILTLLFYFISQVHLFFYCFKYIRQDVVFFVNTMMPFGAALSAKLMRKKVIYHVHETSLKPKLLKLFLRSVIQLTAHKVIFVSNYLKKVESFSSVSQYVVHNALDIQVLSAPKQRPKVFNVLMICSLKEYKGVKEFLEIAKVLSYRIDIRFTLVLNADQVEIERFFSCNICSQNIDIFSRHSDVQSFYLNASMLVNLSRPDGWIETFGLTILEGMAYGLPVIVPPVGGPTEIVADGQEGYLISCYETEKIANVIEQVADDLVVYSKLSANSLRRAQFFEISTFNRSIADIVGL